MSVTPSKVDLSDVRLKLDWAAKHIETFRQTIESFQERNPPPFGFRAEEHPQTDGSVEHELYAIVREQPPRELALIIGDVVHNVRSALDHLVYALSSRKAQRSGNTQFPIFTDECRFKVKGVPMIESIKGPERTLIENVQPFAASDQPKNDPLAILNRLSNLDKHRLPVTTIAAMETRSTWISSDNADCQLTFVDAGAVEHDQKIVAFTAKPHDQLKPMNVVPQADLRVQISEKGLIYNISALDVLRMIHHHAAHDVIGMWFDYGHIPPTLAERNTGQKS
jgi:hypothetical protein